MAWKFHLVSIFILIFFTSTAELAFCPKESLESVDDALECFQVKSNQKICRYGKCSGDNVCRTGSHHSDIACLINACQVQCGSSDDCVIDCLSLEKCSSNADAGFFTNCVRNVFGLSFFSIYKEWIIGIGVCCLGLCCIIGGIAYAYSPTRAAKDKAAYEAALRADPYRPAAETTVYNPNVYVQMPPKMVPQGAQIANSSVTSVGPAPAKTTSNPKISAA